MDFIIFPFSWLMNVFYDFTSNYGLAVILFALVVKVVLFPMTLKGKKGMIQMTMLSGKLDQLKRQYGKDQARYNQEMQKLYEREKVNPMSGCLWSFLPLLILLPLYAIIREPLNYMMGLSAGQIDTIRNLMEAQGQAITANGYEQLQMAAWMSSDQLPRVINALGEGAEAFSVNFSFFGINLAAEPTWKIWTDITNWSQVVGPFLLVIISTLLSVVMGKVSSKTNKINQGSQAKDPNKTMMLLMPLMSLWIGFMMPAAMCIYWIANSVFSMIQDVIASRMLKSEYEAARKASEERERQAKEDEKRRKEEARLERERRAEEEKKNRKKGIKKDSEPEQEGVNKDDSREGLRAHARGRAYIPDRFGGVTEYTDPDLVVIQPQKGKKMDKKEMRQMEEDKITGKVDLTGKAKTTDTAKEKADDNKESV